MSRWDDLQWLLEKAVGGTVLSYEVDTGPEGTATLVLDTGTLNLALKGDCCSVCFWTDKEQFRELVGAKILSIEQRSEGEPHDPSVATEDGWTEIAWHFLVFTTDRGHITVDWRNESNGYYDGWINAAFKPYAEGVA